MCESYLCEKRKITGVCLENKLHLLNVYEPILRQISCSQNILLKFRNILKLFLQKIYTWIMCGSYLCETRKINGVYVKNGLIFLKISIQIT
jgi:hypothetical protein